MQIQSHSESLSASNGFMLLAYPGVVGLDFVHSVT